MPTEVVDSLCIASNVSVGVTPPCKVLLRPFQTRPQPVSHVTLSVCAVVEEVVKVL